MIIRFIYVYREFATGRPVYVGSAFDVARRDEQHVNRPNSPFDRELVRRGRSAYTLEIIDTFTAESFVVVLRESVCRENRWMDTLRTYRTEGCFNFLRATVNYENEQQINAARAACAAAQRTPGARARMSAALKAVQTPEIQAKKSAAMQHFYSDAATRKKTGILSKQIWADAERRMRQSKKHKEIQNRPENLAANALRSKILWADLEKRERQSSVQKAIWTDERKAAHSAAVKAYYAMPGAREQRAQSQKEIWAKRQASAQ